MLPTATRLRIVSRIKAAVAKHHFNSGNIDLAEWSRKLDEQTPQLTSTDDDHSFEIGIQNHLSKLRSSHADFYCRDRQPSRPEHAIGATLRSATLDDRNRWFFLDVFDDCPAAHAGIAPGDVLVSVNGIPMSPPTLPTFRFGETYELKIHSPNGTRERNIDVAVPQRKARLPLVEPKAISSRMLSKHVGLVRIPFFPGAFGLRWSTFLDAGLDSLKSQGCDRLIIDLRGCLGGGLGFAHLVSYLCPDRIPIGYDVTRRRQQQGYRVAELPTVAMPGTRLGLILRLAQFSIQDKSLMLLTQGLGKQPFHGRVAVLVNEWTACAGEMAAQFAKDTKLAPVIGQKTAGLVLGSETFDVGNGYTLYLPVFGWYSPDGGHTEGSGVEPDVTVAVQPEHLAQGNDAQLCKALELVQ